MTDFVSPFTVALEPGKFSAPARHWRARLGRALAYTFTPRFGPGKNVETPPASVVMWTEATKKGLVEGVVPKGWGIYHNPKAGPSNIAWIWDEDRWELLFTWEEQLHDIQIWAAGGAKRPFTTGVGVVLRDKWVTPEEDGDGIVAFFGFHADLENTERRRQAKDESMVAVRDRGFVQARELFPKAAQFLSADWNKNADNQSVREWFAANWRFTPSWVLNQRGHRAIDWTAAGKRLVYLGSRSLPRMKGNQLDHPTHIVTWAWDALKLKPRVVEPAPPVDVTHACPFVLPDGSTCGLEHLPPS